MNARVALPIPPKSRAETSLNATAFGRASSTTGSMLMPVPMSRYARSSCTRASMRMPAIFLPCTSTSFGHLMRASTAKTSRRNDATMLAISSGTIGSSLAERVRSVVA